MQPHKKNEYWPCLLVKHAESYSIILSNFYYFTDYLKTEDLGGYTIERLAKSLLKDQDFKKEIDFDSEAGMFCAYSKNKQALLELSKLFRAIVGQEADHISCKDRKMLISEDEAEKLLLAGFVKSLDISKQKSFLENVTMPSLTVAQTQLLASIGNGTNEEVINAAKKINAEARMTTRKWDNYLSHPDTITILLSACNKEDINSQVYLEITWALAFICDRHLPDLRTKDYFIKNLSSKSADIRWVGLLGLNKLNVYQKEYRTHIEPMLNDKSKKVREMALKFVDGDNIRKYPSWMFAL